MSLRCPYCYSDDIAYERFKIEWVDMEASLWRAKLQCPYCAIVLVGDTEHSLKGKSAYDSVMRQLVRD